MAKLGIHHGEGKAMKTLRTRTKLQLELVCYVVRVEKFLYYLIISAA